MKPHIKILQKKIEEGRGRTCVYFNQNMGENVY